MCNMYKYSIFQPSILKCYASCLEGALESAIDQHLFPTSVV